MARSAAAVVIAVVLFGYLERSAVHAWREFADTKARIAADIGEYP